MKVMCIQGHAGLLQDGNIYNVIGVTQNGNYLLEGVDVPEGYTSFAKERFQPIESYDVWNEDWTEQMEEEYWEAQPSPEYTT